MTKTRYFDPVKMAKRERWTAEETGQAVVALMGYQLMQDEDVCALYPKEALTARVRAVSDPRRFAPYIQLSNWLNLRRQEIQLKKAHAMNMIQLLWRSQYVSLAREAAQAEADDPETEKKRRALVEAPTLSSGQQERTIRVLFSDLRRICAFNALLSVAARGYRVDTFGYAVPWESEKALYEELILLNSVSTFPLPLFELQSCEVPEDRKRALAEFFGSGYEFSLSDSRPLDILLA